MRNLTMIVVIASLLLVGCGREPEAPAAPTVDLETVIRPSAPLSEHAKEVADRLDIYLSMLHERGYLNGALVAGGGGEIFYAKGFGPANLEAAVPFTPRTPADGGSLAKTLTAAAILILDHEGALSLDDPVQAHLPEFPYAAPRLRHLITHTSGFEIDYDPLLEDVGEDNDLTNQRILEMLAERKPAPNCDPGACFSYSSISFDLAALVIERVSGQAYGDFLRERIFTPLEMRHAFIRPARFADWPGVRTLSYTMRGSRLERYDIWEREGFHGGSNIYLSADDLYRWTTAHYLGVPVLRPPVRQAVTATVDLGDGQRSGIRLGSWYGDRESTRFHYSGVLRGFYGVAYWDRQAAVSFGFVTNANMPQWVRPRMTRALAEIVAGREAEPLQPPPAERLDAEATSEIAGEFSLDGKPVRITQQNDRLVFSLEGHAACAAFHVDAFTVYVPGLDLWLTFTDKEMGRFQTMHLTDVFREETAQRLPSPEN